MELWQWVIALLAGAVGQFLDALAGMGFGAVSGSVMVAGGMAPAVVVATVSLAKIGSGVVSGLAHWKVGNVRPWWVAYIALPGMAGGALSAYLLTGLPVEVVRLWVPVVLLIMGVLLLHRFVRVSRRPRQVAGGSGEALSLAPGKGLGSATFPEVPTGAWMAVIGLVAGFINGLSGAFGPVATTAVTLIVRRHPRYAIGSVNTAEIFVALAVSVTMITRLTWDTIGWQLPLALMAGSLFTAPLGAYMISRMPARVVGVGLALVLLGLNSASIIRAVVA